jgi:DNA-binding LacI/PurR family transcriptional regulator
MTTSLLLAGRRALTLFNGPKRISAYDLRAQGFWRAIREFGDPAVRANEKVFDMGFVGGVEATETLLREVPATDAIVCSADITAAGVLDALARSGFAVPGDIAVTGFDDIDFASHSTPTLSTVRMPLHETGATAVSLLLEMLGGGLTTPEPRILETTLVERESTGSVTP